MKLKKRRQERTAQRGVSALEFALVAPLVLLMIFAAVELMLILLADVALETAVTRTQRETRYQWTQPRTCSGTSGAVRQSVLNHLGGWAMQPGSLSVTVVNTYPATFPPANSAVLPCADQNSGWILYRVTLERAGALGIMSSFGAGLFQLNRTLLVRNLP